MDLRISGSIVLRSDFVRSPGLCLHYAIAQDGVTHGPIDWELLGVFAYISDPEASPV